MNETINNLEREIANLPESQPRERAERLNALAFALHRFDITRAAATAAEAYTLATTVGEVRTAARSLSMMAECRRRAGAGAEALELIERAERIATELGDTRMLAQSLHQKGMILHTLGRMTEAVGVLQQAIDIAATLERNDVLIGAHDVLGLVYHGLGMRAQALEQHLLALGLLGEGTSDAHAAAHTNVAGLYLAIGDDVHMLKHAATALEIYRKLGNSIGEAGTLMNIGMCHEERERWAEALAYYDQALALAQHHPELDLLPTLLGNIGTVHERLGAYTEALRCHGNALELAREGRPGVRANILRCLGTLHISMGNIDAAAAALSEGLAIAEHIGDAALRALYHDEFVRLHETTGDAREALRQYRLAAELREQTMGDQVRARIQELRIEYELRRMQAEHELMRERTEALQDAVEQKSRELAAMALHLAHKQKSLTRMKKELERQPRTGKRGERKLPRSIREAIDAEIHSEHEWERFRRHFDTIHPEFVGRLSGQFPTLTPTEIKICALLRLQLSSKDIAALLCVSRLTVDTHRQSLRRKLGLAPRANLVAFLLAF